jgi:hypothetical protein
MLFIRYLYILLLFSFVSFAFAGVEKTSPTSFRYSSDDGHTIDVVIKGYVKQENINKKTTEAATSNLSQDSESSPIAEPDTYTESPIKRVYTVDISLAASLYGMRPGLAFIIQLLDGRYLFVFYERERLRFFTMPKMSRDPVLYQTAMNSKIRPILFQGSGAFDSLFLEKLENSGSTQQSESGINVLVVTYIPHFMIAGLGQLEINGVNIHYTITSTTEFNQE